MKKLFPPQNQDYTYLQTNRSDVLGSLWSGFNLDFQTNIGVIRLAQKLVTNTTSSDDSDLGLPSAFELYSGRWWAICNTTIFRTPTSTTDITAGFVEDTSTGAVKTYDATISDLAVFDNRIWSTTNDTLYSSTGSTWTSRDTLDTDFIHKLLYFKNQDRLYYTLNDHDILSINASNAVAEVGEQFAISLGDSVGNITTMVATSNLIWIGLLQVDNSTANTGNYGSVVSWDGNGIEVTSYPLTTAGVLAMVVLDNIPYAIDSEGRILGFNQQGFQELGRLPINRILLSGATITSSGGTASFRYVHFNGMVATKNNTLLVSIRNVNQNTQSNISENLPSGVWEFDLATRNFTHRYSFSLKSISSSTVSDYGQNRISAPGALKINTMAEDGTLGRGTLLAGCNYFTDATTVKSGIFIDSPASPATNVEGQKRGYFVTTWFTSDEIQDKWTRLWTTYRRFLDSTDKIIFKYRLNEETPTVATITWTSTNTFTTTTDVSAYAPAVSPFNSTTGGEVEVVRGTGSGSCTHISSIVNNSGTYTVTLDNVVPNVTGTATARFQKWIKIYPEITGQVKSYESLSINDSNVKIQIKCVMEWTGDDEFYKMAIWSNEDIKINA